MRQLIRELHVGATRGEVYRAISSERDFQDSFIEENEYYPIHTGGEFLVMLDTYLRRAQDKWTFHKDRELGDEEYLHEVRKIAAMCVRCMEEHGAPMRVRDHGTDGEAVHLKKPRKKVSGLVPKLVSEGGVGPAARNVPRRRRPR